MFQILKYFISPKTSGKKKILEIECQNVRNGIDGQGHDFKLNLNFKFKCCWKIKSLNSCPSAPLNSG